MAADFSLAIGESTGRAHDYLRVDWVTVGLYR